MTSLFPKTMMGPVEHVKPADELRKAWQSSRIGRASEPVRRAIARLPFRNVHRRTFMDRCLVVLMVTVACVASAQEKALNHAPDASPDAEVAAMIARAARPGDEALSCEQLKAEIEAIGVDSRVQSVIEEQGAYAQAQMEKAQGTQQGVEATKAKKPSVAGQVVKGIVSSFIPPNPLTGMAQQAAAASKNAQAMAESEKNVAEMLANAEAAASIAPKMARGARVVELANAKGCKGVGRGGPPPDRRTGPPPQGGR
jgi:hypothetical protein